MTEVVEPVDILERTRQFLKDMEDMGEYGPWDVIEDLMAEILKLRRVIVANMPKSTLRRIVAQGVLPEGGRI